MSEGHHLLSVLRECQARTVLSTFLPEFLCLAAEHQQ